MQPFVVSCDSSLSTDVAWARVTDWPTHGRWVPLTTVEVTSPTTVGVGTVFNARTAVGALGFDDPMEVVEWQPPVGGDAGRCRMEKRGRVMLGWAELTVEPMTGGSRTTWTEAAKPAFVPGFAEASATLAGRLLFGRVLRKLLAA